jgi:hypothetical protein
VVKRENCEWIYILLIKKCDKIILY